MPVFLPVPAVQSPPAMRGGCPDGLSPDNLSGGRNALHADVRCHRPLAELKHCLPLNTDTASHTRRAPRRPLARTSDLGKTVGLRHSYAGAAGQLLVVSGMLKIVASCTEGVWKWLRQRLPG